MIDVHIRDPATGASATISKNGELVTGHLDFSVCVQHDMDVIDTAFNFFKPKSAQVFVVTDVIINATRTINNNGSIVEIYEADDAITTSINLQTFKFDMARQQAITLNGLNMKVSEGEFLNAKCDSATVLLTICGYFGPSDVNRAKPTDN